MKSVQTLLSPSQVACFTDCSAKWWFKYRLKLPDPKNANLALGIAVHESLGRDTRTRPVARICSGES